MRLAKMTATELWNWVLDNCAVTDSGCWEWQGPVTRDGFVQLWTEGKAWYAHRWMHEQVHGPVPEGLVLDHECHVSPCHGGVTCLHRRCLNPGHTMPVTRSVNIGRNSHSWRTHCPKGHPYNKKNTYRRKSNGARQCNQCAADRALANYHRKKSLPCV